MEKEIKEEVKEVVEEMETQTTFNEDGLDVLVEGEDCSVENEEEVIVDANEDK